MPCNCSKEDYKSKLKIFFPSCEPASHAAREVLINGITDGGTACSNTDTAVAANGSALKNGKLTASFRIKI